MELKLNIWIRYLLPLFLALFLGVLIWMMAQFREPPGFAWHAFVWFASAVFLIWEFGWWISKRLDRDISWQKNTLKRLLIQLLATNFVGLVIFDGSYILLNGYENQILHTDNPLAWLHILVASAEAFIIVQIINGIQISYQLLANWQRTQLETEQLRKEKAVGQLQGIRRQIDRGFLTGQLAELETLISESPGQAAFYLQKISETFDGNLRDLDGQLEGVQAALSVETGRRQTIEKAEPRFKTRFLVRSGPKFVVVPVEQIAGFYKDDLVLLITRTGKKYVIDASLEELESQLPPQQFFRINRQCIVHIGAIQEVRPDGAQLTLALEVDFPKPLYVSQRNAGVFKRWLDGEE